MKLFLDDIRNPIDVCSYMYLRMGNLNIYHEEDWNIVKNYDEFINFIENNKLPEVISFDHDLNDIDGELVEDELTGLDCIKWLGEYCIKNNLKLPKCLVHSANPVGTENIIKYIDFLNKYL